MYYSTYGAPAVAGQFDPTKGSIYSYVKSKQVYICPDDSIGMASGDSYAINSCVETPNPTTLRPQGREGISILPIPL